MSAHEWTESERVEGYLARADQIPHRAEGEAVLLDHISPDARRVLDLGTGDGRVLALLRADRLRMTGIGLDFSEPMLAAARERFAEDRGIELVEHDLNEPLPELGRFDTVVSAMSIHHLEDDRKRSLLPEVYAVLEPGGTFANFEHVASPTEELHRAFLRAINRTPGEESPSDHYLDLETQLGWLRETGFADVDCYWKWLELALLIGVKPGV